MNKISFSAVKSKDKITHFVQTKVDISKDSIYVNGNRISKKLPPKLYFAVNKPKGLVSSFSYLICVLHL
jgi:16S rRNA U516 pseudouridylate synthase RsuA-like enzyme